MRAVADDAIREDEGLDDQDAEETAIVARSRDDPTAFAPVYRRYYRSVLGYCLSRLRDPEAAADATSQTFTRALGGLGGFRGGSVRRWLFTIARHVVIDAVRARRPQVDLARIGPLPDASPLPEARAIASERERLLYAALDELTDEQRHVVELRLAALASREVAEVLGLTLGAVKASQHRAYAHLRRLLGEHDLSGDLS